MDIAKVKAEFGLRLKSFRRSRKITQEKFSEIINLSSVNLSNIENGKNYPDFITLCSIIEKIDIEPDYLLGFLREKNNIEFKSIDLEIMKLIIKLTEKQKMGLMAFLSCKK